VNKKDLMSLLGSLSRGKTTPARVMEKLRHLPYEDLKFAKVDHHRHLIQGIPEVVYAPGKKPEEVVSIVQAMLRRSGKFLVTKATADIFKKLDIKGAEFYPASGVIAFGAEKRKRGGVAVISAGTSDLPVAEEAAVAASYLGSRVVRVNDVGVAGLHRLLENRKVIQGRGMRVIVVVAGMEGALPSVIGGFTDKPIIAVPTSVGYGTSLGGLTALFAMLNSCVPGIAVMNIDNGFGAGCLAHKINIL
jgi:NCAIR mutase (PurE)-related protein